MRQTFRVATVGLCAWVGAGAVIPAHAQNQDAQSSKISMEIPIAKNVSEIGLFSLGRNGGLVVKSYLNSDACNALMDHNPEMHGSCINNYGDAFTSEAFKSTGKIYNVVQDPHPDSEGLIPQGAKAVGVFNVEPRENGEVVIEPGLTMTLYSDWDQCLAAMSKNIRANGACVNSDGDTLSTAKLYSTNWKVRPVTLVDRHERSIRAYSSLDACLNEGINAVPHEEGLQCVKPGEPNPQYPSGREPARRVPVDPI